MNLNEKLSRLPKPKQEEIAKALDIILKIANPEKVILFGSYAKGKWVDDITMEDGITFHYQSDFDFLVVIKDDSIKEFELKSKIENRAFNSVRGIVSPLVHSIDYINEGLIVGQYFFKEIIEEGILLYDTGTSSFVSPKELSPFQMFERAQEYFEIWFQMGKDFLIDGNNCLKRGSFRKAMFEYHQAVEHFYASILLVLKGFKPKSHNIEGLRTYSKHLSSELFLLFDFSSDNPSERLHLEALKKGYIDARYSRKYKVSLEDCVFVKKKVSKMQAIVKNACLSEMQKLKNSLKSE
ncbi:HEPN domain-containing protein [Algoriphagus aquaeductus]|uniref:HEPN domain-containing protein n=1 Tax=Algoriphagus aquaeductus TaxID=475299 RepID=A0A326RNN7_9BACT|nr:HEPN domain-containing protein [Algoriphagus aquaeductus]PZV77560.1 HEPN domain-containing protein [Algoriphagus aquaeductus]